MPFSSLRKRGIGVPSPSRAARTVGAPLRSKWRDDLRVVLSLRRAAPSARSVRIPDEGGASLYAARLRLGKPPQKWDDTEVVPPGFEGRRRVEKWVRLGRWPSKQSTRGVLWEGHRPAWPKLQPRSGVSSRCDGVVAARPGPWRRGVTTLAKGDLTIFQACP